MYGSGAAALNVLAADLCAHHLQMLTIRKKLAEQAGKDGNDRRGEGGRGSIRRRPSIRSHLLTGEASELGEVLPGVL